MLLLTREERLFTWKTLRVTRLNQSLVVQHALLPELGNYGYVDGDAVLDIAPHEINKAMKLLWLLNPDIERVRYTESGVTTEISFK